MKVRHMRARLFPWRHGGEGQQCDVVVSGGRGCRRGAAIAGPGEEAGGGQGQEKEVAVNALGDSARQR